MQRPPGEPGREIGQRVIGIHYIRRLPQWPVEGASSRDGHGAGEHERLAPVKDVLETEDTRRLVRDVDEIQSADGKRDPPAGSLQPGEPIRPTEYVQGSQPELLNIL